MGEWASKGSSKYVAVMALAACYAAHWVAGASGGGRAALKLVRSAASVVWSIFDDDTPLLLWIIAAVMSGLVTWRRRIDLKADFLEL